MKTGRELKLQGKAVPFSGAAPPVMLPLSPAHREPLSSGAPISLLRGQAQAQTHLDWLWVHSLLSE